MRTLSIAVLFLASTAQAQLATHTEGALTLTVENTAGAFGGELEITFRNTSDSKKVSMGPWCEALRKAKLTDDLGNEYEWRASGLPEQDGVPQVNRFAQSASLYPGKSLFAWHWSEAPVARAKTLTLSMTSPAGKPVKLSYALKK